MAKKRDNYGVVFSTDDSFEFDYSAQEEDTIPNSEQNLKVSHDRKARKGKTVTLILGFIGSEDDMKDLGKTLKSKCGVGGSVKNGEIVVQGENRDKVLLILKKEGYSRTKLVGGK